MERIIRTIPAAVRQEAVAPFMVFLGDAAQIQLLLSDACEWTDVPPDASRFPPSVLLAMLVSLEANPASPMVTLVFHDGEHHHGVSFVKVEAARVFFHDPFGAGSMLAEGKNQLGVAARAEPDGTFSLSANEFETSIAAMVVAFIKPTPTT